MTTKLRPAQCLFCARHNFPALEDGTQTCTAFTRGIPDEIWTNQADHRQPFAGDGGKLFEAMPGAEFPEFVLTPAPTGGGG